mgnify:CR=1 FL=1
MSVTAISAQSEARGLAQCSARMSRIELCHFDATYQVGTKWLDLRGGVIWFNLSQPPIASQLVPAHSWKQPRAVAQLTFVFFRRMLALNTLIEIP